jgi:hypothetical protein
VSRPHSKALSIECGKRRAPTTEGKQSGRCAPNTRPTGQG